MQRSSNAVEGCQLSFVVWVFPCTSDRVKAKRLANRFCFKLRNVGNKEEKPSQREQMLNEEREKHGQMTFTAQCMCVVKP
jgi:hypothetical protein